MKSFVIALAMMFATETIWVVDIWIISGQEVVLEKELIRYDGQSGWSETGRVRFDSARLRELKSISESRQ